MIKVRLHGTPEEITKFADFLEGLLDVRVFTRSEPYADRGKSVYERVYMDVELLAPVAMEITLNDSGNCPYKGTSEGKEVCAISFKPTNSAVQCDFEFESCELYQRCEKYRKEIVENEQARAKFISESLRRLKAQSE